MRDICKDIAVLFRFSILVLLPFYAFFFMSTSVAAALENEGAQTSLNTREFEHFRQSVRAQSHLGEDEMKFLSPRLREYCAQNADREQVRKMIREAAQQGCRGECLAEVVNCMSKARDRGKSANNAREMVQEALKMQLRENQKPGPSMKELGQMVRARLESQHRSESKIRTKYDRSKDVGGMQKTLGNNGKGSGGRRR